MRILRFFRKSNFIILIIESNEELKEDGLAENSIVFMISLFDIENCAVFLCAKNETLHGNGHLLGLKDKS